MYVAVKALAYVSAAFSLVSASDAPTPQFVHFPAIHQVFCDMGRGTAFEAGGKMISVSHVTSGPGCTIEGADVYARAEAGDFSTIHLPANGYKIDCGGFKKGEYYWAIGFAHGLPIQRMIVLLASGYYADNEMAILVGYPTVIPGMSGGIVMSARGEAVGTINAYNPTYPLSFSRELKGTSLCRS